MDSWHSCLYSQNGNEKTIIFSGLPNYLLCSIGFGMLIVLLIECVQPIAAATLERIPLNLLHASFITLFTVYVIDNIYSFASYRESIKKLIKMPQLSTLPVIVNLWREGRKTAEQVNDKTA